MSTDVPDTVLCYFRVKPDQIAPFLELCQKHERTLRGLGLCGDTPTQLYRGKDDLDRPFIVKIFDWKSPQALEATHRHADVQIIWEAMEPLCEARDGRPSMEFPHLEAVAL